MWSRLKLFDKVLIVSGTSVLLTFGAYLFFTWKPPRHFILPAHFSGWVTIRYEKPGAPALGRDGNARIFEIPENGILETSERLDFGWGKDLFFRRTPEGLSPMPDLVEGDKSWIHHKSYGFARLDSILLTLPKNADTLLFDGSHVEMAGDTANVRPGRRMLQHFYVSEKPESLGFIPVPLPKERENW